MNNAVKVNNGLATIVETLQRLPGIEVLQGPGQGHISLRTAQQSILLRVVSRNSGYPRDVRNAVWQAQVALEPHELILIVAPSLAPGSREWLQSQGISYADEIGHLFISANGIYVLKDDMSQKEKAANGSIQKRETNIFRGRATQVLHSLLHVPLREWHVTDLADEAGVASGTALRVCETLERMLLIERYGRGPRSLRRLTEPGKLLDAWADQHKLTGYHIDRFYRWHADLGELSLLVGGALEAQGSQYAATLSLGAMHRAPFLTQVDQVALLAPARVDVSQLASVAQLKTVDDGANVLLLRANHNTPLMYRQRADDLWVASDIQIYLDLHASPARGKEQAEHLRHERLGF